VFWDFERLRDWWDFAYGFFLIGKIPLQFQDVIRLIVWLFFCFGFDPSRCMYVADGLILCLSWSSRCSRIQIDLFPFCFGFGFDLQEVLIGFVLIQKMMMMMMMIRRRRRSRCWS
jgi:hypothetical protein